MSDHPNVGTENSKRRHRLPKMCDHLKRRHLQLKMFVPTTQNVGTDHPKCPTTQNVGTENSKCWYQPLKMSGLITQNVRPPKMSAPPKTSALKTQNVGT